MHPQLKKGDSRVKDIKNKISISNGPLIYCLEQKDNKDIDIFSVKIQGSTLLTVIYRDKLLGGVNIIEGKLSSGEKFTAIPYYAWNNRGPDKMQIWHQEE